MQVDDELISRTIEALDGSGLDPATESLVLAALMGDDELASFLDGVVPTVPAGGSRTAGAPLPPRTYLSSIAVRGFRGIGGHATLKLPAGPGLTLVVGRNGSGKSSFAEALEYLITGTSKRWEHKRVAEWRTGWRNLHLPDTESVKIAADFQLDGCAGTTRLTAEWAPDADMGAATTTARATPRDAAPIELSFAAAKEFRPILSYPELAALSESTPSALYDSMASILGLDSLQAALDRLDRSSKVLDAESKALKAQRDQIRDEFARLQDPRGAAAAEMLAERNADLDALAQLAQGSPGGAVDGPTDALREVAGIRVVGSAVVEAAAESAMTARVALAAFDGTDEHAAAQLLALLRAALAHHDHHGDEMCPVCGGSRLDAAWRTDAEAQIDRLETASSSVAAASKARRDADDACRALVAALPRSVPTIEGIDLSGLEAALDEVHGVADPVAALSGWQDLLAATELAREAAMSELRDIDAVWNPMARKLGAHLDASRDLQARIARAGDVKKAKSWLNSLIGSIRDERFVPIQAAVQDLWNTLRCASNVALDAVTLTGNRTRRKIDLSVSVDGVEAKGAFGVMSQGELNALAISLFLPRATLPGSPFGFVVIDDPVQAMDPARVDGLARVLDEAAKQLQVIVFTHDERLAEAVRNLAIDARVVEVSRCERSEVTTRIRLDPVSRLLDDARAITLSDGVEGELVERVTAGLCRQAVEAAAVAKYRRRSLDSGIRHSEIETRIQGATKFTAVCALGIWGDATRGGDVIGYFGNKAKELGDAAAECARGAHYGTAKMEPDRLVRATEQLCSELGWRAQ